MGGRSDQLLERCLCETAQITAWSLVYSDFLPSPTHCVLQCLFTAVYIENVQKVEIIYFHRQILALW
jgi:hypothetical protein